MESPQVFPIHSKSVLHLISHKVPIVSTKSTIHGIKQLLNDPSNTFDSINYIYVLNQRKHLVGVISIKEVMSTAEKMHVEQVMQKEIISVSPHAHRESVAHLALKNNIKEIPVLEKEGEFLGVVSSDTITKIANEEVTEDMMLLEGIYSKDYADIATPNNSALHLLKKRLPWLLVGLGGGLFAAQVIGFFESLLEKEVLLISFLPLMVYMSDAVGSQSQTIFIRYVAINNGVSFIRYLIKEVLVGVLMAFALAILLAVVSSIFYDSLFSIVIGISLFCAIILSVMIAIVIPWVLIKFHKDPAVGSGPFATILRDILSIIVYFGVSHILYALR